MRAFAEIKDVYGLPVVTDVHETSHCAPVAEVVDVLQIPAFLCRQTNLLIAAGATGAAINMKKGQFLAPWDMANVVAKIRSTGNDRVMVCERGASFGYNTLVSDMRSLPIMAKRTGCPVVYDATHSVQQPGGQGATSGAGDSRPSWPGRGFGRRRRRFHGNPSRSRQRGERRSQHDSHESSRRGRSNLDEFRPVGEIRSGLHLAETDNPRWL